MTDNIKPEHYRTGEIDLYEAWYRTYPFNEYRAIMQAVAERYMRRDKIDRVEDLKKAIYTLERLKEKEIEHAKQNSKTTKEAFADLGEAFGKINFNKLLREQKYDGNIYLLKYLLERGFNYLARDESDELYAYQSVVYKVEEIRGWDNNGIEEGVYIQFDNLPEVKWADDKPTKIAELLATYENGGENGKVDGE